MGLKLFEARVYSGISIPLSMRESITCRLKDGSIHVRLAEGRPHLNGHHSIVEGKIIHSNYLFRVDVYRGGLVQCEGELSSDDGPGEASLNICLTSSKPGYVSGTTSSWKN